MKHFMNPRKRESKASNWMMVELHCVAQLFAAKFNERRACATTLTYISAYILQFESNPSEYWMIEEYVEGDHEKWNNNAGWADQKEEVAQAFSHFTWHDSEGEMMIVDVQGVKRSSTQIILTDPAIHSKKASSRWESGLNTGEEGMKLFFNSHTRNSTCTRLRLRPYRS